MRISDWSSDVCSSDLLMIATSLLPIGLIQFHASVTEGMWYARSEEFMQQPLLQTLRWVRTFGDVVFIVGALSTFWQVVVGLFQARTRDAEWVDYTSIAAAEYMYGCIYIKTKKSAVKVVICPSAPPTPQKRRLPTVF